MKLSWLSSLCENFVYSDLNFSKQLVWNKLACASGKLDCFNWIGLCTLPAILTHSTVRALPAGPAERGQADGWVQTGAVVTVTAAAAHQQVAVVGAFWAHLTLCDRCRRMGEEKWLQQGAANNGGFCCTHWWTGQSSHFTLQSDVQVIFWSWSHPDLLSRSIYFISSNLSIYI